MTNVGIRAHGGERRNEFFYRPQQQAHLGLRPRTGILEGARHARRGEGQEEIRHVGRLQLHGLATYGGGVLRRNPFHERIHVREGTEVCWNYPQRGRADSPPAVELLIKLQALVA